MSTTLINFNILKKDITRTLGQISSDKMVARDTAYYKENIGKISSVKDFLANQRLYSYAMKANGLEDMIYAKGFMKKVLESDLSDENSYANRLSDDRYRKFALSFNFSGVTTVAQTQAQEDDVIGLYNQSITNEDNLVADDTRYYNIMMDSVQNVDQLLTNERLRTYVLKNFGYDPNRYSYSNIRSILTSDVSDPQSYVNQIAAPANSSPELQASYAAEKARALNMVNNFSFNTDGSIKNGAAQTASQKAAVMENYVLTVPTHKTPSGAAVNRLYYDTKIKTATNVSDITGDARMWDIVRTGLDLDSTFLKTTFEFILTSDLNDPDSYVNKAGSKKDAYTAIAKMFNFATNGTVAAGSAQTSLQENQLLSGYNSHYDDIDESTRAALIKSYKNNIDTITTVDKLLANTTILNISLAAFGIGKGEYILNDLKKALTSDLSDPKSFANQSRDPRLVKLAQDFNFDATGKISAPKMAQSQSTITETAKNYIIQKTRFIDPKALEPIKKKALDESTYYQAEVGKLKSVDALLANRRLVDFNLVSKGIDPTKVTGDFLKKIFKSDLNDPKSFANTQADGRFKQIVASFNFDASGNLLQSNNGSIQDRGHRQQTLDNYLQQELEVRQGEENPGVRLALYFERKAQTITSAYDILGDSALLEVFKTTFQMPDQFSSMKIEQQQAVVLKKINLPDLKDPEKVKKLIQRFSVFYDMKANEASGSAATSILSGGGGGISADTLYTLSQLRGGR